MERRRAWLIAPLAWIALAVGPATGVRVDCGGGFDADADPFRVMEG